MMCDLDYNALFMLCDLKQNALIMLFGLEQGVQCLLCDLVWDAFCFLCDLALEDVLCVVELMELTKCVKPLYMATTSEKECGKCFSREGGGTKT